MARRGGMVVLGWRNKANNRRQERAVFFMQGKAGKKGPHLAIDARTLPPRLFSAILSRSFNHWLVAKAAGRGNRESEARSMVQPGMSIDCGVNCSSPSPDVKLVACVGPASYGPRYQISANCAVVDLFA